MYLIHQILGCNWITIVTIDIRTEAWANRVDLHQTASEEQSDLILPCLLFRQSFKHIVEKHTEPIYFQF